MQYTTEITGSVKLKTGTEYTVEEQRYENGSTEVFLTSATAAYLLAPIHKVDRVVNGRPVYIETGLYRASSLSTGQALRSRGNEVRFVMLGGIVEVAR